MINSPMRTAVPQTRHRLFFIILRPCEAVNKAVDIGGLTSVVFVICSFVKASNIKDEVKFKYGKE